LLALQPVIVGQSEWVLQTAERLRNSGRWMYLYLWKFSAGDCRSDVCLRGRTKSHALRQFCALSVVDGQGTRRPAGVGHSVEIDREQLLWWWLVSKWEFPRSSRCNDDWMS